MLNPPKAVIYARVSSDDQGNEGRNLAGQLQIGAEYARIKGYEVVAELAEDERGVSGADPDAPQLMRAIQMARQGKYNILIVRQIDRLARNLAKQLTVEKELTQVGVTVEYVLQQFPNDRFGRLNKHILASISELEREEIAARTSQGKRNKAAKGHVITAQNPPYGYRQIAIEGGRQMFEIVESEARIVVMIFDWYIQNGWSYRRIADELTQRKIETYTDSRKALSRKIKPRYEWNAATIGKIIRNPLYTGVWTYGKDSDKPIAVQIPPIITPDIFNQAANRRQANKQLALRNTKQSYLLRGRLRCKRCNYAMTATSKMVNGNLYLYYVPVHRDKKMFSHVNCGERSFQAGPVDDCAWSWIKRLIGNPDLLEQLYKDYSSNQDNIQRTITSRIDSLKTDLRKANDDLGRLLQSLWETPAGFTASRQILATQQEQLEKRITDLQNEQQDLIAQLSRVATADDIVAMAQYFATLNNALILGKESFEDKLKVLDALQVKVFLYRDDGGQERMDIYCRFAYEEGLPIVTIDTHSYSHNFITLLLNHNVIV